MYAVKPLYPEVNVRNLPANMYEPKGYGLGGSSSSTSTSGGQNEEILVELNRQQQSQQRRLTRLQAKLDELCEDLRLDHLISSVKELTIADKNTNNNAKSTGPSSKTSPKAPIQATVKSFDNDPQFLEILKNLSRPSVKKNDKQALEDLVVQVDPNEIPYSIFVQFQQLASNYRCFVQFHRHSSILGADYANQNAKIQSLINLFNGLNYSPTEARSKYDYVLTVIFKSLKKQQPVLATSALGLGNSVHGESNILRYLAKLSNDVAADKDAYSSKLDLSKRIFIDEQIDRCTNELLLSGQRDVYLKGINGSLAKSQYLTAGATKPTLADLYAWSLLKQSNVNFSNLKPVNEWSERVEKAHPLLKLVKTI